MQVPKHEHYITAFYFVFLLGAIIKMGTEPTWLNLTALGIISLFLWLHRLEDFSNKD